MPKGSEGEGDVGKIVINSGEVNVSDY